MWEAGVSCRMPDALLPGRRRPSTNVGGAVMIGLDIWMRENPLTYIWLIVPFAAHFCD